MEKITVQEHAVFWKEDDGILYGRFSNLSVEDSMDHKTAQLYIDAILKLSKGEAIPLLIDLSEAKGTISNAAAQLLSKSSNDMPCVICEAYVVESLSVKLLVQAYKRIYNTKIPHALFKNVASARDYCLEYKTRYKY